MGLVKKTASIETGARQKQVKIMDILIVDVIECNKIKDAETETICRICARSKTKTKISYVNVDQIDKLKEKVLKYLNIHVTSEDLLPKSICIKCFRMLNLFHEFVLMSKESQKESALIDC